ncbi:MAG: acetyl-CoA acetyltransferase [Nitrososphaerota archaeon]|nr:acetyl-CoA acetyltransferase [Candidatus Bathyarchaeota archaeon]MDW8022727.1 acetyl-CoA acetyltransferase [Nitrososphaerota archaeon]
MPGVKDKVAIIGMGCTKFGEQWDKSVGDLIIEACYEAFEDAGVEPKDIQAAWLGTAWSGELGRTLAYPLKIGFIPITRVENRCASGHDAFINACYAVACGAFDLVLVCGAEKIKDTGLPIPGDYNPTTLYTSRVDTGFLPVTAWATLALRYFHHYGIPVEEGRRILSKIAVKNHYNGSLAPKAQFQRRITLEEAMNAPMVAYPLALYDCCGIADGAAAAILTRAELAKNYRDDYVLVKGVGMSSGMYQGQVRDNWSLVHVEENVRASKMAYAEAGIKNPRKELDIAEVHDCFTIHELVIYEDFGFSPRGKAKEDVDAGTFELKGELPVNADGGLKCFGHPLGASGLRMIYEVYKQLQGKAGQRQVAIRNQRGLTHTCGGTPVDSHTAAIAILGLRGA